MNSFAFRLLAPQKLALLQRGNCSLGTFAAALQALGHEKDREESAPATFKAASKGTTGEDDEEEETVVCAKKASDCPLKLAVLLSCKCK
eukprot:CAMPEP_0171677472 /NCGR_PEP_ID=MMETSP0990-20121206/55069_1 /TAXON_ID=483369 /ORGANISM="non described non described, Strain CCMP2098" /LENGTH=88 /DNA_ID=CAMNT_0012263887 /DNA_START=216 /DNA_END=482 /DNA_ORIENTATION=-